MIAFAEKVQSDQIRFASKISNERICVDLANKDFDDDLLEAHKTIKVRNQVLHVRPLIARNKRVVLSNVPPIIPHSILENKLKLLSIEIASSITFLRVGLSDPQFAHIMGFRRQLYVNPDDDSKLPDSIQMNFDKTSYWIYITSDIAGCYRCKDEGHVARDCPTLARTETQQTSTKNNAPCS